ncbi:hypothetical protein MIN45_P0491 [Methylomarinovum tepidoasis]|uniref:HNH nuclease domain-containing protein n=1 Tax=Methylomarinovum tepidoasis TaxID=2840183 RepID=A0AAU9CVI5_9GAMM|nr:HNH endonuclease signature motif containing protein [Methylomarinovum sp. IN45]BCX88124.1 hypothetical protein MIN45_P0491 [Methylomarinovum sp. IN45]
MNTTRKSVPPSLKTTILYKSAFTCCVCREKGEPVEIHHIDQNPSNNAENNLVVLCKNCHDEAHTKHSLSQNLTPERLKKFKKKWEEEVKKRASYAMLPGNNLDQAMWTFINHQKLPLLFKKNRIKFRNHLFEELKSQKIMTEEGILNFQNNEVKKSDYVTIYDHFRWDIAQKIHYVYMYAIDDLILKYAPIELGAIWTKKEIKNLIKPGAICYCMRGFIFKKGPVENGIANREAFASSKNIVIRFIASTFHMYGVSSYTNTFLGSSFIAALLLIKNIFKEQKKLILDATPLALGAGFIGDYYNTPYPLKYTWAKR